MKFQLNKLMAGLVMAGSAVALVGCGGGDAPDLRVTQDVTQGVGAGNTTAIAATRTILAEAQSVSVQVPTGGLIFPADNQLIGGTATTAANETVAAGSTLTVTPATSTTTTIGNASADVVAAFSVTNGTNSSNQVTGDVVAGSCVFIARAFVGPNFGRWTIGGRYRFPVCNIILPVKNVVVNVPSPVFPTLTLGTNTTTTVLTSTRTVTVTLTPTTDNKATVTVGSTEIKDVSLPTGATP